MSDPTIKPDRAPVPAATPILSYSPVVFDVPGRPAPMEVRVVAPATGGDLSMILLSHGHGASNFLSSMRGYGPLVDFYAAHGFVVVVPTHLDGKTLDLDPKGPEGALFWRSRAADVHVVLDRLDEIEATVPGLGGRLDRSRVAAVGHSLGGMTVAMLAGMRVTDPETEEVVDAREPRIGAFIMFAPPGDSGQLSVIAGTLFPVLKHLDFSTMDRPALVVVGDKDTNIRFSLHGDYRAGAYRVSPGPKELLTIHGAEHMFGGISGYDAKETTDEDPQRVADIQRLTWAYLRSALYPGDPAWTEVGDELATADEPAARIDRK